MSGRDEFIFGGASWGKTPDFARDIKLRDERVASGLASNEDLREVASMTPFHRTTRQDAKADRLRAHRAQKKSIHMRRNDPEVLNARIAHIFMDKLAEFVKPEAVREWMLTPNPAFGERTPLKVIEDGEVAKLYEMLAMLREMHREAVAA